jgi:hypothetical protein
MTPTTPRPTDILRTPSLLERDRSRSAAPSTRGFINSLPGARVHNYAEGAKVLESQRTPSGVPALDLASSSERAQRLLADQGEAEKAQIIERGAADAFARPENFKGDMRQFGAPAAQAMAAKNHGRALNQLAEGTPLSRTQLNNAGEDGASQSRLADMSSDVNRLNLVRGARQGNTVYADFLRAHGLTEEQIQQFRAGGGRVNYGTAPKPAAPPLDRQPGAGQALARLKAENAKTASLGGSLWKALRARTARFSRGVREGYTAGKLPDGYVTAAEEAKKRLGETQKRIIETSKNRRMQTAPERAQRLDAIIAEQTKLRESLSQELGIPANAAKKLVDKFTRTDADMARTQRVSDRLNEMWARRVTAGLTPDDAAAALKNPRIADVVSPGKGGDFLRQSLLSDPRLFPGAARVNNRFLQIALARRGMVAEAAKARAVDPKLLEAMNEAKLLADKFPMPTALPPAKGIAQRLGRAVGANGPRAAGVGGGVAALAGLGTLLADDTPAPPKTEPAPDRVIRTDDLKNIVGDIRTGLSGGASAVADTVRANPLVSAGIGAGLTGLGAVAAYHLMKRQKRQAITPLVMPAVLGKQANLWAAAGLGGLGLLGGLGVDQAVRQTSQMRERLREDYGDQLAAMGAKATGRPVVKAPTPQARPARTPNTWGDIIVPSVLLGAGPLLAYHLMSRKIEEENEDA